MPGKRPFWESTYADPDAETFGPPSEEVVEIASMLPEGALALDVGCGDGRNAICLAEHGLHVDAFDVSTSGIWIFPPDIWPMKSVTLPVDLHHRH